METEEVQSMSSFEFVKTPAATPPPPSSDECGLRTTNSPAIKNAPLPVDGPGSKHFSNYALIGFLVLIPYLITRKFHGGLKTWIFFFVLLGFPILMSYWTILSTFSPRLNERVKLPNLPISHYLEFHTDELNEKYVKSNGGKGKKIPMETFIELYFDQKVSFKGDCLDVLESRYDWCTYRFTLSLFRFFLLGMIPEVIMHTRSQDEEQVRDHYDRGDDFYAWFLGSRMIYTSGIISDINKEETLEEMQDNKLRIVCEKINLQKGDRLLDLGCGWGTLASFASYNYGAHATGITLGRNQTKWGNDQLAKYGISPEQSKILCMDYRDVPVPEGKYNKITALEMSEHVGIKNFGSFLQQIYDMLDDDGIFYLQYSGLRKFWQYEDLNWGLFMNKYIFPGADASTPLDFTVSKLEAIGFEVVSVDNVGVHYSGTLWRWYRNWLANRDNVVNKYGIRWFRIWEYFLASSTITSRQGSATCYQIVLRKNLNSYHRVEYIPKQSGLIGALGKGTKWAK